MDSKTNTIFRIMHSALHLFKENGFDGTSIRQVANDAEVSLGMVNHYFGVKDFLGAQCLTLLSQYAGSRISDYVRFHEDPILYDLTCVRADYNYFWAHGYDQFYIDCLKNDIFFTFLTSQPSILLPELSKHYPIDASEDEILLYSKYMPYMLEKTLLLKKKEGMFKGIEFDHIPYMICALNISHFVPVRDIQMRDEESKRIAAECTAELADFVPDENILTFVDGYCKKLQAAQNDQRKIWLETMTTVH